MQSVCMKDACGRAIDYLRVSLTDRCNLRCIYCMPEEGIRLKPYEEIMRLEEILRAVKVAVGLGIRKVRLTGGEPLVRRGAVSFVAAVAALPGLEDLAMTTNGILLPQLGQDLRAAGLKRVNISLDTLKAERFRQITRVGDLREVWKGIEAALELGFSPVKLNVVVMRGVNDDELLDFAALAFKHPLHVRFIECMPIGESGEKARNWLVPQEEMLSVLSQHYQMEPFQGLHGAGPAKYYRLPGGQGTVGFISPVSHHFCRRCNRLRLTADGKLRPCLLSRREIDLLKLLRSGAGDEVIAEAFLQAVRDKPLRHYLAEEGWEGRTYFMHQIGG